MAAAPVDVWALFGVQHPLDGRSLETLAPKGQVWRTGANANTKITFSSAVTIGGKTLEPGTYAVYSKPGIKNWEIIF